MPRWAWAVIAGVVVAGLVAGAIVLAGSSSETRSVHTAAGRSAEQQNPLPTQNSPAPLAQAPTTTVAPTTTALTRIAGRQPQPTAQTLPYDSRTYFELSYNAGRWLCKRDALAGFQHYGCVQYSGGSPPSFFSPGLYCNGSESLPQCDPRWYPDVLANYHEINYSGQVMLCQQPTGASWSNGDLDCADYLRGDPSRLSFNFNALKCSPTAGSYACDRDYYPSEMEGLFFTTINSSKYVCKTTFSGSECYPYSGGSPKSAMLGAPTVYCNTSGICQHGSYPKP